MTFRRLTGTALMAVPVLTVAAIAPLGVLMGSLGMDIHWQAIRWPGYVVLFVISLILLSCPIAGQRLRRVPSK